MTDEKCAQCGRSGTVERVADFGVEHGGKSLTIVDRQTFCIHCDLVSYIGDQIEEHELAVSAAIREMEGLLSAEELRRIRAKYRLTQTNLEQMLSTGPKTWTRWERGRIPQSKAADTLIRVIAENPDIARRLMEQAGIVNPEASSVFAKIEDYAKDLARAALRVEIGMLRNVDVDQVTDGLADRVYDTVENVRRQAAARAEAA